MRNIVDSTKCYDAWLKKQLKADLVQKDLREKHKKMAQEPFLFLRATYWRWAETMLEVCPELAGPQVLAVGDIHLENFGTWRDADGRLIWGVNDFDEAARMPYALDIVRLATSAVLAEVTGASKRKICESILDGYRAGIKDPKPFILDRENPELRAISIVDDAARTKFWKKFDPEEIDNEPPKNVTPLSPGRLPPHYGQVLKRSRPDRSVSFRYFGRAGGTGSLGRPRIFGSGAWRGDLIVREAKAIVPSGWVLAHGGSPRLRCEEIATGKYRAADPTCRLYGRILVRRLSPNDFKIEAKQEDAKRGRKSKNKAAKVVQENPKAVARPKLVNARMLFDMGREIAAIHCGTPNCTKAIAADLRRREDGWLRTAVKNASRSIRKDFAKWRAYYDKHEKRADDAA